MDAIIKEWLDTLDKSKIDEEIEQTTAAISNERLWASGAPDEETAAMHEANIERYEEYIRILEEMKNEEG